MVVAWLIVMYNYDYNPFINCPMAQRSRHRRQETLLRRDELFEEPGDAVLLSDAVCSEPHGAWFIG